MPKKTFDDWIFSEGSQNLRESRQTLQVANICFTSATKPFKTNMSETLCYTKRPS